MKIQKMYVYSQLFQINCMFICVKSFISKQSWYHGALSRNESEGFLRSRSEGSYLVRSIDTTKHEYSLALK